MSNRAKGNQYEKEVVAILERDGWVVERARPKIVHLPGGRVFTSSADYFGAWDILGKRVNSPTLWVQVSVWEQSSAKRKQVINFPCTVNIDSCAIYARMRGRNPHFRIMWAHDGYQWTGETAMVIKKVKKEAA